MVNLVVKDLVLSKSTKGDQNKSRIVILKGINAEFRAGELNAIMGPNGCGKTTFLDILYGYRDETTETSGQIFLDDAERNVKDWFWSVSYVQQQSYQIDKQTASQVIQFAINMKNSEEGTNSTFAEFKWMFEELYINDILDRDISVLSGGERQRVLIAAELVMSKNILILDEPTSDLDSHLALNLMHFLKTLAAEKGILVIFTIHQPSDQIFKLFDNLLFMNDGKVYYNGKAAEIEAFFASKGIVNPPEWSICEFIFEAFYGDSNFEEIAALKQFVDNFKSEVTANSDKIVTSAVLSQKEMEQTSNTEANFKKAFYIAIRRLKLMASNFKFQIRVLMVLLIMPCLAYFTDRGVRNFSEEQREMGIIFKPVGAPQYTLDALDNPYGLFFFIIFQAFLGWNLHSFMRIFPDVSVQTQTEIRKKFYSPKTLALSCYMTDFFIAHLTFFIYSSAIYCFFSAPLILLLGWVFIYLNFMTSSIFGRTFYSLFLSKGLIASLFSIIKFIIYLLFAIAPFSGPVICFFEKTNPDKFQYAFIGLKALLALVSIFSPMQLIFSFFYYRFISGIIDIKISDDETSVPDFGLLLGFLRDTGKLEGSFAKKHYDEIVCFFVSPAYHNYFTSCFSHYLFLVVAAVSVVFLIFLNFISYQSRLNPSICLKL